MGNTFSVKKPKWQLLMDFSCSFFIIWWEGEEMVLLILSNVSCTYKQWERDTLCLHFIKRKLVCLNIKGSDRLFKVVELNMQCCGQILSDSFETSSWRSVNPEFERKFDVQNSSYFGGWIRFQNYWKFISQKFLHCFWCRNRQVTIVEKPQ